MRYGKKSVSPALRNARVEAVCRNARVIGCSLVALLLSLASARADVVADWTRIALHTVISSEQHLSRAAREMATVHVAMFESMNFMEGSYIPRFVVKLPQPLGGSSDTAAAAAAHHVLVQLHPEQEGALDAALQHSVAAIPDAEKSSALITGKSLGAIVYSIWTPDPNQARSDISGSMSKTSRVRASTRGSGAIAVAWYWMIAQIAEGQRLRPIESARLYALVSMALSDLYGANRDATRFPESAHLCGPCAASAAVQVILDSELGTAGISGMTLTGPGATGAAYVSSRIREYGRGLSSEQPDGGVSRQTSIEAGEKAGRAIGLRALANYRPLPAPVVATYTAD